MIEDTIFAPASGGGRAAVAVIRVSGPGARLAVTTLAGRELTPRHAHYVRFRDPETNETLDQGLALYFPAPKSATGEDCAELHVHGGRAVLDSVLTALGAQKGLRLAEPGEFARRALLNGKLDLSQIEGLADLIDANTEFQRRQALRLAGGTLRRRTEAWRGKLVEAMALLAADLDFADESDVEAQSHPDVRQRLLPLAKELESVLDQTPNSDRLREGFLVLIMGPPNAGKSSLLNSLVQRDAAIVSEEAGTTRDLIEVELDIEGAPVTLVDTAGLRAADDRIESLGVARARARAGDADLVLWLSPGGKEAPEDLGSASCEVLRVASKADIYSPSPDLLAVSVHTSAGLSQLRSTLAERAKFAMGDGSSALIIRERHRAAISAALRWVRAAMEEKPLELVAEDLRLAARSLARIVGSVDTEELLDLVFSRFCIGK